MPPFARQVDEPNLLAAEPLDSAELRGALRFYSWANRRLGGRGVLTRYLESWSTAWPRSERITFLDIGTAGADVPLCLMEWARARGFRLRVTAIEAARGVASIARERLREHAAIEVLESDLFSFVRRGGTFDYVIGSLVLREAPERKLTSVLRACDALALRGMVICDVERSWPALFAARAATLFGNRVIRHDGPLSVKRGFLASELTELAAQARLPYLTARRHPFFRVSLAGQKAYPPS